MTSEAVIWHDVECAAYDIDLPLWRRLAVLLLWVVIFLGLAFTLGYSLINGPYEYRATVGPWIRK